MDQQGSLRITEIFASLQGEASRVGTPTVFVRLTGCPLRCVWCDTAYSFTGGESLSLEVIMERIRSFGLSTVCVTGGEPLAQKTCLTLLSDLCDAGYSVSLETSGALDISHVDSRVSRIVDIKAPGSGEVTKNRWENLAYLTPQDEIKLVIADETDYLWARDILSEHALAQRCTVFLSPVQDQLAPQQLAEWILRDRLSVRMQIQMHKIIWGNQPGH